MNQKSEPVLILGSLQTHATILPVRGVFTMYRNNGLWIAKGHRGVFLCFKSGRVNRTAGCTTLMVYLRVCPSGSIQELNRKL